MPRQHVENTKEFCSENEAKRANKHANRRIIYWPPFWNKVYSVEFYYVVENIVGRKLFNNCFTKLVEGEVEHSLYE